MASLTGYQDLKKLVEGRERVLYSGLRLSDQKPVILKMLRSEHPSADSIALLCHEYEIGKDLDIPGVLKTYELIDEHNQYALVLEDMQGISLHEYLRENPIRDLSQFFKLAISMTKIVSDLHRNHIIHKDIKPDNFIIQPKTLDEKLTDFNFSSKLPHEVQEVVPPDKLEGTLDYMAPEQTGRMNMNIDYRSDFYALGVTFYEMLCGELPFQSDDPLELIHAHLSMPAPTLKSSVMEIPEILAQIVQKLMSKNPTDRYQSAMGLQADLERCQTLLEETGKIDPFPLAQRDVLDRLNLSQKLYGREEDVKILLAAYGRVSQGAIEGLMVCGYSGIGKTMLINEVHKPMVEHKGYFISGKFDQLQKNKPYTAITQAFNQLARLISAEPEHRFEAIKKELLEALRGVAQIMIDLAPDFELILGPQPPLEKLPPQESQARMMVFFKRFLSVIANHDHPLVVFIDDLQWIDSGSLTLFEYILTDESLSHILLMGAYRDNEVNEHHPLQFFFNQIGAKQRNLKFLPLKPLTPENFAALFRDSFGREEAAVKSFAQLIHKRTEGNPFFCKQVIGTLYQKKLLYFDYEQRRWNWNLENIAALGITENVVTLMLSKLEALPIETQDLLQYAACLGNRFSVEMLMLISGQPAGLVAKALWPALQNELVLSLRLAYKRVEALNHENLDVLLSKDIAYQFVHDRVQQAAYQSISEKEKKKIHLKIARLLLEKESKADEKQKKGLFEATDHFNHAQELIEASERIVVAKLNYESGMQAQKANAYQPMSNYLKVGVGLTADSWWDSEYEFTFELNRAYAFSLYLLKKFEELEQVIESLMTRAKNPVDKVRLIRIQILAHATLFDNKMVLSLGSKALGLMGIRFINPPQKIHVFLEFIKVKWRMRKFHPGRLDTELNPFKNIKMLDAIEVLTDLYAAAWLTSPITYSYLSLIEMKFVLDFGKFRSAGFWIQAYAIFLINSFGKIDEAFQLLKSAEKIYEESPDKYTSSLFNHFMAFTFVHLKQHFKCSRKNLQLAREEALESGNISIFVQTFLVEGMLTFSDAQSIHDITVVARKSYKPYSDIGDSLTVSFIELQEILFTKLELNQLELDKKFFDIINRAEQSVPQSMKTAVIYYECTYYYFAGLLKEAVECLERACKEIHEPYLHSISFFEFRTLGGLALAKLMPSVSGGQKHHYQKRFHKILKKLKWISKECPVNYLHHYLFLKGAKLQLKQRYEEAIQAFNQGIENAKKGDFYLWIALGNELAGDMLIEQKQPRFANDYIREAHYYYQRYGMLAKVKSLEARYPQCFVEFEELRTTSLTNDTATHHATTTTTTSAALDFMSVIKSSQAISGEIILEKLFEKILHILLENAGAESALFLEKNDKAWLVTANLKKNAQGEIFQMLNTPLDDFPGLPQTIIRFSIRSQETVVLRNASEDNQFGQDPYLVQTQAKSVLCMPIIHHDAIIGVIYLENNLTVGAFTRDRITVLTTLASQIAISLENSHYLAHMERLYRSTERFVPRQFLEMLQRKTIEEIKLGDCLRLDISVLFADIRKFTTILETLDPEAAFAFVNRYWAVTAPVIRKYRGFINQYQGDGILALFPSGADDAVAAGMGMLAVLKEFNQEQIKLNAAELQIGVGINSGSAMIGIIGEKERLEPAVVSDIANTASRVETLNKTYGTHFLLSGNSFNALKNPEKYQARIIDKVKLKGRSATTYLHEIIDWEPELQNINLSDYLKLFSEAFSDYEKGNFSLAQKKLVTCLNHRSNDQVAETLKQRCEEFVRQGAPSGWDGVYTLTHK